jgi:hypothetical protein
MNYTLEGLRLHAQNVRSVYLHQGGARDCQRMGQNRMIRSGDPEGLQAQARAFKQVMACRAEDKEDTYHHLLLHAP